MGFFSDVFDFVGDLFEDVWDLVTAPFEWLAEQLTPDIPEIPDTDVIYNTVAEGVFVARCYGRCKVGGNKLRYNDPDDSDIRIIIGHCRGEVEAFVTTYINDIEWDDLKSSPTKTEYVGSRTQTADARFSVDASAYRSIAYTAFTFGTSDKAAREIGTNPNIVVVLQGLKCDPIGGGAKAFTRNPAVILWDWYLNVEGYSAGDLDENAFLSLEELCDEVPSGGTLPRYMFDYNFDRQMTINDAKKFIWSSFNGRTVMSQGKLKPVWDSSQMADGAGSLTAKTVSHAFDEDDIVKKSLSWNQVNKSNVMRVHFRDSEKDYKNSSVEDKDEHDIAEIGEILVEDKAWFITDAELARRRAKYKFNKFNYEDYIAKFSTFSGASGLEVYDLVTVTHSIPGWTNKPFYVVDKSEDAFGRMKFTLRAYYAGVHDDAEVGTQLGFPSDLPNPYTQPTDSTDIIATLVATGTTMNFDAVKVSFTPPADYPFYAYSEIHASSDDSTYYLVGQSSGEDFVFNGMGAVYQPGETVYIKLVNVNEMGIPGDTPVAYQASVVVTGYIRFGSFYVGPNDIWGGNAAIGNVATEIVMGNLDGTPKIALGATADAITYAGTQSGFYVDGDGYMRVGSSTHGLKFDPSSGILDVPTKLKVGTGTYIDIDGANARIRSSNYVAGVFGAGFTLEPDLLEVGNIAARGILRSAVFEYSVMHAVGGFLLVMPADVLAVDMTAADNSTLTIEGTITFAVGDFLRIRDGIDDEWFEVTNTGSAPTYTVTRDMNSVYGADNNPTWTKGAAVLNFQSSGGGLVMIDGVSKRIGIHTHTGTPWVTTPEYVRIGNLNNFLDYDTEIYGFAVGTSTEYIKIDPTNGIRIAAAGTNALTIKSGGSLTVESGGDINIESGGDLNFVGSSYTTTFDASAVGEVMYIDPSTADVVSLYFGYNTRFKVFDVTAHDYLNIECNDGSGTASLLQLSVNSGQASMAVALQDEAAGATFVFGFDPTGDVNFFGPNDDGESDLGRDDYRWRTIYGSFENIDSGWINRSDWTNVHLGLIVVAIDNESSTEFELGETITGGTSGVTGVIHVKIFSQLHLKEVTSGGLFVNDEEITGGTSGATADVNAIAGIKNVDSNIRHGWGVPLSELMITLLVSSDGTDANSVMIQPYQRANNYGMTPIAVSDAMIKIQTASAGLTYTLDTGAVDIVNTDDWYYKIRVYRMG